MTRSLRHAVIAVLLTLAVSPAHSAALAAGPDFDREIAPLLARRCLACHSGAKPKGGLDLSRRKPALAAVVPGRPNDSQLWQRIRDNEMPPKKPLPAGERALLRAWIAADARWGSDPIDAFRVTTASRAGYDWWSLRPLARVTPPAVRDAQWPRTPIDCFVLAKLEAKGVSPSPSVDRRVLIRRLTFDLTGLPPSPEEVSAFLADVRPDAYERLVDRLLASPAYGERWGRHWLDVVRFGESDGFERDLPRFNAWPYRDWVVSALNRDLPYDEFVRLQLAGDVLRPGHPDALAATGFLVAGPHDIVVPASDAMKESMRQDELEDVVSTVGQTFLGMTVHCARCHEHKFDPISQKDYYRLASALAGVGHGEQPWLPRVDSARIETIARRLEHVIEEIVGIEEPVRRQLLTERSRDKTVAPRPLAEWDFTTGLNDRLGGLHGKGRGSARQDAGGLSVDGKSAFVATVPLSKDLREKTLEAWVWLDNLAQRGGGVISVQTLGGGEFDAIVFGEQEPGRWMAGSNFFLRTRSFNGPLEKEATRRFVHIAIVYDVDGTIRAYRDGATYGKSYRTAGTITFRAGKAQVLFGLRHGEPNGNRLLAGRIRLARLYDRALSPAEIAASAGITPIGAEDILSRLTGEERERHRRLLEERELLTHERERLRQAGGRKVYAILSAQPVPTRLLLRGNVTSPSEVVAPEIVSALAERVSATRLKPDALEGQRRLALARWITDANNPLFARVIVNRLWQYHFGVGLVETASDFGFNGARPSHPELLDFLAGEMIRRGWSMKAMHRLIVLSAVYRQSSRRRNDAMKIDADNRLLWRKTPVRLEAEAVRDAMLAAAGRLDRRLGGPSYRDFRTYFFKGTQFYDPLEQVGPAFTRRSLYRMGARGGRSPFLDTFDCPDPSTTTPRRAVTTTPLQALALLNNAIVLDLAEQFARRLRHESGDDITAQVRRAFELAYARPADGRELAVVVPFVRRHGLEAFCRVVFNSNNFVQVD
jgi:hypothetical protein